MRYKMKNELLALKQNLSSSYISVLAARDSLEFDIKEGTIDPGTAESLRYHFLVIQEDIEILMMNIQVRMEKLNED